MVSIVLSNFVSAKVVSYMAILRLLVCLLPVKLKIKSFKVPELLIEIPETASVGSLKVFSGHCALVFFLLVCPHKDWL
jgi:hypothetical protein